MSEDVRDVYNAVEVVVSGYDACKLTLEFLDRGVNG